MNSSSYRTDRLFVTGPTARALAFMARVAAAQIDQEPAPDAADAMAENILSEWLSRQPELAERQKAIRKAIADIDQTFTTSKTNS